MSDADPTGGAGKVAFGGFDYTDNGTPRKRSVTKEVSTDGTAYVPYTGQAISNVVKTRLIADGEVVDGTPDGAKNVEYVSQAVGTTSRDGVTTVVNSLSAPPA